jgi:hypothetical protein
VGVRALPGSVHDKKTVWVRGALAELEAAGLVTLADKGYWPQIRVQHTPASSSPI